MPTMPVLFEPKNYVICEGEAKCRAKARHVARHTNYLTRYNADGQKYLKDQTWWYPVCDRHAKTLPEGSKIIHSSAQALVHRPGTFAHTRVSYLDQEAMLYCFGCRLTQLHTWADGKYKCPNCGMARNAPTVTAPPALEPEGASV